MEDNNTNKLNPYLIAGVSLTVVVLVGIVVVLGRKNSGGVQTNPAPAGQVQAESTTNGPVKEFTVDGTNFAFSPKTITVNKGDIVKITFRDDDGRHNLIVNGYNVATDVLSGGEQTIQFFADKTGQFEYYCSVGEHRDLGMTGTLIVQ